MSEASDKLARSRLALIEHVHRKQRKPDKAQVQRARGEKEEGEQWEAAEAAASSGRGGWFKHIGRAAKAYWRHHPARVGVQMATPMLSTYARKHPAAYLGAAAAAGVIFMIVRPWRLISVTGLLVALAKSPQLASVVMAAMSGADQGEDEI